MSHTLHLTYITDDGLDQIAVGVPDAAEAERILARDHSVIFATLVDDETQTRRVLRGSEILKEHVS